MWTDPWKTASSWTSAAMRMASVSSMRPGRGGSRLLMLTRSGWRRLR
jgi:hypothetical protein